MYGGKAVPRYASVRHGFELYMFENNYGIGTSNHLQYGNIAMADGYFVCRVSTCTVQLIECKMATNTLVQTLAASTSIMRQLCQSQPHCLCSNML